MTATYRNTLLSLLCLTAGIVDVIGYLSLGHVFTANMTGNIVLLGLAIGKSLQVTVFNSLTALIGFICGVIISTLMVGKAENTLWPSAVTKALALEAFILFVLLVFLLFVFCSCIHPYYSLEHFHGIQTIAPKAGDRRYFFNCVDRNIGFSVRGFVRPFVFKSRRRHFKRCCVKSAGHYLILCRAIIVALAEPDFITSSFGFRSC